MKRILATGVVLLVLGLAAPASAFPGHEPTGPHKFQEQPPTKVCFKFEGKKRCVDLPNYYWK